MRLKTCNKRKRRNFWKRRGCTHVRMNRGIWLRTEIVDPSGNYPGYAQQTIDGHESPKWYRWYP